MARGNDPILDNLGMAHLASPKVLLGGKGRMLEEFREFAMRGSMLDMAVGIIVGAAFGRVVSSFVSDVLMPRSDCSQATQIFPTNSLTFLDTHMPRSPRLKLRVQQRSITASSSTPCSTS